MISDEIRAKIQNIVRGTCFEGPTDRCSTVRNLLIKSFGASPTAKGEFEGRSIIKERQVEFLKIYARESGFWLASLTPGTEYLTRGGESKVYLSVDGLNVVKINDAIYYATWTEYFDSLVLHNLLFPNTTYSLLGFMESDGNLNAVLSQPFIEGEQAKLENIKDLLSFNGFENTKRQDYYNKEFGLMLEDMHDENVIIREGILFFIDTVFYIMTI
jgi:Serine/Threonine/Tyrosine Kinase found in polyvalent proteins